MEMEATWGRAGMVWWAYIWRLVLCGIGSSIVGGIVGAVIGFVLAILKVPREAIIFVSLPVGLVIGTLSSIIPMKLIIGKDFGDFRLVLVSKQAAPPA
jgi:ABC-type glycerol-3-phosphate transport system permease component